MSARSLNAVATLGVVHGDEILVHASGPQAAEALAAIRRLADEGFGEPPDDLQGAARAPACDRRVATPASATPASATPASATPASSASARPAAEPVAAPAAGSVLRGLPGSPGIAVGAAQPLVAVPVEVPDGPARDRAADWAALERALAATADDIRRARDAVAGRARDYDAAIFDAHLLFLDDEALLGPARAQVLGEGRNAAAAWAAAVRGGG